jgi:hypothetical protein
VLVAAHRSARGAAPRRGLRTAIRKRQGRPAPHLSLRVRALPADGATPRATPHAATRGAAEIGDGAAGRVWASCCVGRELGTLDRGGVGTRACRRPGAPEQRNRTDRTGTALPSISLNKSRHLTRDSRSAIVGPSGSGVAGVVRLVCGELRRHAPTPTDSWASHCLNNSAVAGQCRSVWAGRVDFESGGRRFDPVRARHYLRSVEALRTHAPHSAPPASARPTQPGGARRRPRPTAPPPPTGRL